jgi:hypothetical protein
MRQLDRDLAPDEEGFARLLATCDDPDLDGRVARAARKLQASLRSSRNRLLAHVRPDHAAIRAWDPDEMPSVSLVSVAGVEATAEALERLNRQLRGPLPTELLARPHDALDILTARAAFLTSAELWALDRAMRVVGHVSLPLAGVVSDVLLLASRLEARPGLVPTLDEIRPE